RRRGAGRRSGLGPLVGSAANGARLAASMRCHRLWPTPDSGDPSASTTFRLRRGGSVAHNEPIAWLAGFLIFGGSMGVRVPRGHPALPPIRPKRASRPSDASVDPTDARKGTG